MNPATTNKPRVAAGFGAFSAAAGLMSLLATTPAFAADPSPSSFFEIHFASSSASSSNNENGQNGVAGIQGVARYTFLGGDNLGKMTLNLTNTSTSPVTQSYIVGTGFNLPTSSVNPPTLGDPNITVLSYSTINEWGITVDGSLTPANKFGDFDICASTDENNGTLGTCDGGATAFGVASSPISTNSKDVAQFIFESEPNLASAIDYRNAFAKLYTAPGPDNSFFMRFKGITGTDGTSDKVLATSILYSPDPPPVAPGDEVPGPLPVLGAAAAFGYSRKLRQRLKAKTLIG